MTAPIGSLPPSPGTTRGNSTLTKTSREVARGSGGSGPANLAVAIGIARRSASPRQWRTASRPRGLLGGWGARLSGVKSCSAGVLAPPEMTLAGVNSEKFGCSLTFSLREVTMNFGHLHIDPYEFPYSKLLANISSVCISTCLYRTCREKHKYLAAGLVALCSVPHLGILVPRREICSVVRSSKLPSRCSVS